MREAKREESQKNPSSANCGVNTYESDAWERREKRWVKTLNDIISRHSQVEVSSLGDVGDAVLAHSETS